MNFLLIFGYFGPEGILLVQCIRYLPYIFVLKYSSTKSSIDPSLYTSVAFEIGLNFKTIVVHILMSFKFSITFHREINDFKYFLTCRSLD